MVIPSYDDLTPGIPDDVDARTADRLAVFLHDDLRRGPGDQDTSKANTPELLDSCVFACLRATPHTSNCELLTIARDFSPRVRRVSDCEVLLDVSGLGRLIGEPAEIARQLTHAIAAAGLNARVAVGPTQTIARVMAHADAIHGLTRRHEDHKAHEDHDEKTRRLCGLCGLRGLCAGACGRGPWLQQPVGLLRELEVLPPGLNQRDRDRPYRIFETWGIATLGDLAALPPADLSSRLGRRGVALHCLARGLDPAPFVPDGETPRYIGRLELEWPIDALEPLSFVFARLLDPLSVALERADRGAAAIRLELRLTDRSTHTRLLQLPAPIRDPRVLRTLLLLDLESKSLFGDPGGGGAPASELMIDVVSIELDPAPARITQFSLLQRALPSPETLSTLTARLSALVGEARVGSPALLDSHRPDAFAMVRYAPEGPPSPLRGFGETGLQAHQSRPVLRRRRDSVALQVRVEHGRPIHVAASRQGIPYGAITQAAGPWRASGGWWTTGTDACQAAGKGQGWDRDEWDVALNSGAVCRIFQNRTTDRWFLEGVYD
jgi:protein ImuB